MEVVLGVLGILALLVIFEVVGKAIYAMINPEWGLKNAERRNRGDPCDINERMVWKARRRVREKEENECE